MTHVLLLQLPVPRLNYGVQTGNIPLGAACLKQAARIAPEVQDDVQVFPLSVLPGTDFRLNSNKLGLRFEEAPPYTLIENPTFSAEDLLLAFDHAG